MAQALNYRFQALRGIAKTFYFAAVDDGGNALFSAAAPWATTEVRISKDGGAAANITGAPTRIGTEAMYALALTATEMTADQIIVTLVDSASGAATPSDVVVVIDTQLQNFPPMLRSGTAQGGSTTTITLDSAASATNDFYNDAIVTIVSGTGAGQARSIKDYTGASKVADVGRDWVTAPDSTSGFTVTPGAEVWYSLEGTEPSGAPGDNISFGEMFRRLWRRLKNVHEQSNTQLTLYKDDGTTTLTTQPLTMNGTSVKIGKMA
jgi:hypothetical protein